MLIASTAHIVLKLCEGRKAMLIISIDSLASTLIQKRTHLKVNPSISEALKPTKLVKACIQIS